MQRAKAVKHELPFIYQSVDSSVQRMWEERAQTTVVYHVQGHSYYGRVAKTFGQQLPILKDKGMVLDLGCSIGHTTIELANTYGSKNVIGIDKEPFRINEAIQNVKKAGMGIVYKGWESTDSTAPKFVRLKQLPNNFIVADGYSLPFKNGSFDLVYMMNNLYYVVNIMSDRIIRVKINEIGAVLKPEGQLFISGHNDSDKINYLILRKSESGLAPQSSHFSDDDDSQKTLCKLLRAVS